MTLRVAIVGCGLMGRRRARAALAAGDNVPCVADLDPRRAQELADATGAAVAPDWTSATSADVDAVVVATTHDALSEIAVAALKAGKHVLCEKPMGRNSIEASRVFDAANGSAGILRVGFSLRAHSSVIRAKEIIHSGGIGRVLVVRGVYGHGGRAGYGREWRSSPELSGGGEMLDQGIHLIDLCRLLAGDVTDVLGTVTTSFWPISVEDNAFALLRCGQGVVATLHASWTQWSNLFRVEVLGDTGYLVLEGLGGSYGPERLTVGTRNEGSAPKTLSYSFSDDAWLREWELFKAGTEGKSPPFAATGADGVAATRVVEALYESAARSKLVSVAYGPTAARD